MRIQFRDLRLPLYRQRCAVASGSTRYVKLAPMVIPPRTISCQIKRTVYLSLMNTIKVNYLLTMRDADADPCALRVSEGRRVAAASAGRPTHILTLASTFMSAVTLRPNVRKPT